MVFCPDDFIFSIDNNRNCLDWIFVLVFNENFSPATFTQPRQ